jgi:hypothetical protein
MICEVLLASPKGTHLGQADECIFQAMCAFFHSVEKVIFNKNISQLNSERAHK